MKSNVNFKNAVAKMAEGHLKLSANSTTCVALGQPKAPAALKKFSKIRDDK